MLQRPTKKQGAYRVTTQRPMTLHGQGGSKLRSGGVRRARLVVARGNFSGLGQGILGMEELLLLYLQKWAKGRGMPIPFALPAFSRFFTVSHTMVTSEAIEASATQFFHKEQFPMLR
jgi:hypothetical protein